MDTKDSEDFTKQVEFGGELTQKYLGLMVKLFKEKYPEGTLAPVMFSVINGAMALIIAEIKYRSGEVSPQDTAMIKNFVNDLIIDANRPHLH